MTALGVLLLIGTGAASLAFVMTLINLGVYRTVRRAPRASDADQPRVDVCIPARNEEANLEACVRSVLAGGHDRVRVLVYDDDSTDQTGPILDRLCAEDRRVIRTPTRPLPEGWNGKQHACSVMGGESGADWLLFTDADVRFKPGAIGASLEAASRFDADLVSTFPRQITRTLSEKLVVPMIHFVLFSYLPMPMMRASTSPAASAGCGQFLFVRRREYEKSGGHGAFKASMHDGIMMPRRLREGGRRTDLFDATDLVECRMYSSLPTVWRGFAKNAYEGLGSPAVLVFFTIMHLLGHVLPWVVLLAITLGLLAPSPWILAPALACVILATTQRAILATAFKQPWIGVVLHPIAVTMMTLIQWHSLLLAITGRRSWRGRRAGAPEPVQA